MAGDFGENNKRRKLKRKPAALQFSFVKCALDKMTQSRLAKYKHNLIGRHPHWQVCVANLTTSSQGSFYAARTPRVYSRRHHWRTHRQLFACPAGLVSFLLFTVFVRWGNSLSPSDPLRADKWFNWVPAERLFWFWTLKINPMTDEVLVR